MQTNKLDFHERISIGKDKESFVINLLKDQIKLIPECGDVVHWWQATGVEDRHLKIDVWAEMLSGDKLAGQIKFRESGQDLGIALIRPWSWNSFMEGTYEVDRDFQNPADFYVFLVEEYNMLVVANGQRVSKICNTFMKYLSTLDSDPFATSTSLEIPGKYGAELRLVNDKGEGYTEGQNKIICYIKPILIETLGGQIIFYDVK